MDKVVWDEKYSVGVKSIDSQHRRLFAIINQIIDRKEVRGDSVLVSNTLEKMIYYARYHFKSEEEYMKSIGYKDYTAHKKQHLEFIKKTTSLSLDAFNKNPNVLEEIINFLFTWLTNHILNSDQKISPAKN